MTVKELISKLQSLPPKYQNAYVKVFDEDNFGNWELEDITEIEISDNNKITLLTY